MQIFVNDIAYDVPFDLKSIRLEDFLSYQNEYGVELDKKLAALIEKKYEDPDDSINELNIASDLEQYLDYEALAWFSFWTKHDFFDVKNQPAIEPALIQYRIFRQLLKNEEANLENFPLEVNWNNETWAIQDFKVNPASKMSFNEIITSKEIMRQLYSLGKGRWDGLPYLCAIYFRKKDERFTDEFVHEEGERMTLMKDLPLQYALQVAFFLSCCVNIWSKILVSSAEKVDPKIRLN